MNIAFSPQVREDLQHRQAHNDSFRTRVHSWPHDARMQTMAIPETDLLRIGRWCREKVPTNLRDQLRVECDIADRHVTIIETRPPWDGQGEWTRFAIARLRYTASTGLWSLYWRDRNQRFHEYRRRRPTKSVQSLLDYLDSFEDPIFWG